MRLYLVRDEPVQEIAAHPDTLAQLVAALPKAQPPTAAPGSVGSPDPLAVLLGLPLVPDAQMGPGIVHLRPYPPRPAP